MSPRPTSRKAAPKPLALVRRLASHLALLAEAKAALMDVRVTDRERSPLLTHSVQRALARKVVVHPKAKRAAKKR